MFSLFLCCNLPDSCCAKTFFDDAEEFHVKAADGDFIQCDGAKTTVLWDIANEAKSEDEEF